MTSLSALRDGLKANLEQVPGLRAHDVVPTQFVPPAAIVTVDTVEFHDDFEGSNVFHFVVRVFMARTNQRTAQNVLDEYVSDGTNSLKAAIESDPTLGGNAFSVTTVGAQNFGTVDVGDASYLTADWVVQVGA